MIDFLTRWSRRKIAQEVAEAVAEPPAVDAADALAPAPAAAPPLPALDELTADADFTAFMRPEVPAALRNAAMRRLWLIDPAIRDFVGPARDYAYDWNMPGGVPGAGPLDPSTDVSAMVSAVLGRRPPHETPGRQAPPSDDRLAAAPDTSESEAVPCERV